MSPRDAFATGQVADDAPAGPVASTLPKSWTTARLGSLGHWIGGGTPSKSVPAYWTGNVPWVSPKDMKSPIITDAEDHITEAAVAETATNFVPPGSVLMVMRSGILRHSFPVAVNTVQVTVNQDIRALVPATGIDPNYLAYYLRNIEGEVLHECAKDGTTVQSIEASALVRLSVPVAPFAEQCRIVARVDELFAEIAEGEAALARARRDLDTWRRSLLKAAVTGELTRDWRETNCPTETAADLLARIRAEMSAHKSPRRRAGRGLEPGTRITEGTVAELPHGWVWVSWNEVGLSQNGRAFPSKEYAKEGIKLLRPGNLFADDSVRWNEKNSRYLPHIFLDRNGDLLVVAKLNTGSLIQHMFTTQLEKFVFPLPPEDEQRAIIQRINEAWAAEVDGRRALDDVKVLAQVHRQSILKAAFEGRLVPQDPADEPASVLLARLNADAGQLPVLPHRRRPKGLSAQGALAL